MEFWRISLSTVFCFWATKFHEDPRNKSERRRRIVRETSRPKNRLENSKNGDANPRFFARAYMPRKSGRSDSSSIRATVDWFLFDFAGRKIGKRLWGWFHLCDQSNVTIAKRRFGRLIGGIIRKGIFTEQAIWRRKNSIQIQRTLPYFLPYSLFQNCFGTKIRKLLVKDLTSLIYVLPK